MRQSHYIDNHTGKQFYGYQTECMDLLFLSNWYDPEVLRVRQREQIKENLSCNR